MKKKTASILTAILFDVTIACCFIKAGLDEMNSQPGNNVTATTEQTYASEEVTTSTQDTLATTPSTSPSIETTTEPVTEPATEPTAEPTPPPVTEKPTQPPTEAPPEPSIPEPEHEHKYTPSDCKAATCQSAGYTTYKCSECGDEFTSYQDVTQHEYELAEYMPPEEGEDGYMITACKHCGDQKTTVIPADSEE